MSDISYHIISLYSILDYILLYYHVTSFLVMTYHDTISYTFFFFRLRLLPYYYNSMLFFFYIFRPPLPPWELLFWDAKEVTTRFITNNGMPNGTLIDTWRNNSTPQGIHGCRVARKNSTMSILFQVHFWKFHPENRGNNPIWLIFSNGLKPPTRCCGCFGKRLYLLNPMRLAGLWLLWMLLRSRNNRSHA